MKIDIVSNEKGSLKAEAQKLLKVYYTHDDKTLTDNLELMLKEEWTVLLFGKIAPANDKDNEYAGLVIFKICSRMHSGKVLLLDSIISNEKGLGEYMMGFIMGKAVHHQVSLIQLDCKTDNESAKRFYTKLGFEVRANSFVKSLLN